MQAIALTFSDSVIEEARVMLAELKITSIIYAIRKNEPLSETTLQDLEQLLRVITDLLDPNLPAIPKDPLETLKLISRDNNLARLLSSRSAARLFRFLQLRTDDGVPLFMTLTTEDGETFTTQNDFIDHICKHAHISRSSLYERKGVLERLMFLGYSLEDAYKILVSKPRTIANVLKMLGDWDRNQLTEVDPDVVSQICDKYSPSQTEDVMYLLETAETEEQITLPVQEKLFPVYRNLLEEVSEHDSATAAMDFVQHDLLKKPEISYRWDPRTNSLLIDMVQKQIDKNGEEYIARVETITFEPHYAIDGVPPEVIDDLLRRLPIKNRKYLDN